MKYLCKLVPLPIAKIIGTAMNQDTGNPCLENLPEELFGTEMELEMKNGWFEDDEWAVAPFFIEEIWPKAE